MPAATVPSGMMSTPGGSANFTTLPVATSLSTAPVIVVAGAALSHDTSTIVGLPDPAPAGPGAAESAPLPASAGAGAAEPAAPEALGCGPGSAVVDPAALLDAAPLSTCWTVGAGTAPVLVVCDGCGTVCGAGWAAAALSNT